MPNTKTTTSGSNHKPRSRNALRCRHSHRETAIQKVRLAEDGWNSRDPEKVALAYTVDSRWRNRAEFANGRQEIIAFLKTQVGERTRLSTDQRTLGA